PLYHGRGFAWFALLFLLLYNGGRTVLHSRAMAMLESRQYEGESAVRVAALPEANPLQWRGLVETGAFYEVVNLNVWDDFDPTRGLILQKPLPDTVLEIAPRTPTFRMFLGFSH